MDTQCERLTLFVEQLLQFCLGRLGIVWQPEPREAQEHNDDPLFQDAIGIAVLNTLEEFREFIRYYTGDVWYFICNNVAHPEPNRNMVRTFNAVSRVLLDNDNFYGGTQRIYAFLAVVLDVAKHCALKGELEILQRLVLIIPIVLEKRMPYKFVQNFDLFLEYAFSRGQSHGN